MDSVNSHFVLLFFQGNFSKLKTTCDVNATKGSWKNLNYYKYQTFILILTKTFKFVSLFFFT